MASDDDIRGDLSNPVVAMQTEVFNAIRRYPDVVESNPEYVATLLMDIGDAIRHDHDLDVDVTMLADDVPVVAVGSMSAFINVPREGEYADIDVDALDEMVDEPVEDLGITDDGGQADG